MKIDCNTLFTRTELYLHSLYHTCNASYYDETGKLAFQTPSSPSYISLFHTSAFFLTASSIHSHAAKLSLL